MESFHSCSRPCLIPRTTRPQAPQRLSEALFALQSQTTAPKRGDRQTMHFLQFLNKRKNKSSLFSLPLIFLLTTTNICSFKKRQEIHSKTYQILPIIELLYTHKPCQAVHMLWRNDKHRPVEQYCLSNYFNWCLNAILVLYTGFYTFSGRIKKGIIFLAIDSNTVLFSNFVSNYSQI